MNATPRFNLRIIDTGAARLGWWSEQRARYRQNRQRRRVPLGRVPMRIQGQHERQQYDNGNERAAG